MQWSRVSLKASSCFALCVLQFGETITQLAVLHHQPQVLELIENWRSGNPISLAGDRDSGDDDDDDEEDDTDDSSSSDDSD